MLKEKGLTSWYTLCYIKTRKENKSSLTIEQSKVQLTSQSVKNNIVKDRVAFAQDTSRPISIVLLRGNYSNLFRVLDLTVSNELEPFYLQILRVATQVLEALTAIQGSVNLRKYPVTAFVLDKIHSQLWTIEGFYGRTVKARLCAGDLLSALSFGFLIKPFFYLSRLKQGNKNL